MSRVKHLFAVALAALMLCLLMPITAFAEEASDGKCSFMPNFRLTGRPRICGHGQTWHECI